VREERGEDIIRGTEVEVEVEGDRETEERDRREERLSVEDKIQSTTRSGIDFGEGLIW